MPDIQAHIINLGAANTTTAFTQLSGDVTSQANGGETRLVNHAVANVKLASAPAKTVLGNADVASNTLDYLTGTQVGDMLPDISTGHKAGVPQISDFGKIESLRSDGWGFVLPDFKTSFSYSVGAPALIAGVLYKCITAHTSTSAPDLSKFTAVLGNITTSSGSTSSLEFDKIPITLGSVTLYAKTSAGVTASTPNPGEFVINIPLQTITGGGTTVLTCDRLQSLDINVPSGANTTSTVKVTVNYPTSSVRLWNRGIASIETPEILAYSIDSLPTRIYKCRFAGSGTDMTLDILSCANGTASYLITLPTPLTTGGYQLKLVFA